MATGEGKTLAATMPVFVAALGGRGVHVVTANDYLAARDCAVMGEVFRFLGLTVGLVLAGSSNEERREAYACDVTYVTNSELGFDYLRDNLAMAENEVVMQRPFNFCVVDECDSILIDEARTPLIISSRESAPAMKYENAFKLAQALQKRTHYQVSEKEQNVLLTETGLADCSKALGGIDLFDAADPWAPYIQNALKAKEIFKKDINYIVRAGKEIIIIDEFTGRAMEGRRWSDGLHQSVEAKEGIAVSAETQTIASVSYQSFFRLFPKLGGMTGTASTEADELADIYNLAVIPIPTALPIARKDYPDVVFKNQAGKFRAVMREVARVHPKGQPILIGTTSVDASEAISQLLLEVEVPHEVLNAKPEIVDRESEIIAQAGRKYAITIATNMAGRGTDILLGGNPDYFAKAFMRNLLAKTYMEGYSSDEEFLKMPCDLSDDTAAAVQVAVKALEPNFKSLPDAAARQAFASEVVVLAGEFGPLRDDIPETVREGFQLVKEDFAVVLRQEKDEVADLGGLYVMGTERHESRRVDNQLRGRAGRQGDSGASRFFLALDDNLFRVFGGDKMGGILNSFRVDEDTPIESTMVNNALDNVQKQTEKYYAGIRRSLFDYDEIISSQREAFYSERRRVLDGNAEQASAKFVKYSLDTLLEILPNYVGAKENMEGLANKLGQFFAGLKDASAEDLKKVEKSKLEEYLKRQVTVLVEEKEASLDGLKAGFAEEVERFLILTQMDTLWKQHIRNMNTLRDLIGLRSYGNANPLEDYQVEGYKMFTDMLVTVRRNSVYSLFQYQPTPKKEAGKK